VRGPHLWEAGGLRRAAPPSSGCCVEAKENIVETDNYINEVLDGKDITNEKPMMIYRVSRQIYGAGLRGVASCVG
jgi:hypothetical protein